jgi:ribosomal protein L21E
MADIMEDINDPTNITGMSKLLNKDHVDTQLNLDAIERDMIGRAGVRTTREINPDQEYLATMRELADIAGIPMDEMNVSSYSGSYDDESGSGSYTSGSYEDGSEEGSWESEEGSWETDDENNEDFIKTLRDKKEYKYDDPSVLKAPTLGSGRKRDRHSRKPNPFHKERPRVQNYPQGYGQQPQQQSADPHRYNATYPGIMPNRPEQGQGDPRQQQFNQMMQGYGNVGPAGINVEREHEEETKTMILEDIDELLQELDDDDVDVSNIPQVDQDSPLGDVKNVQKILRMKYDRRRYTTFGTEFILAGVHGLEYLFDGKRKWGPYQPDLTNWHNTVRTKLRRMRYETSMIVSDVMHQYNVGPITRVLLELGPSAFLHSRMRKDQHGKSGYTPDQMSDAYNALREYDNE